MAFVRVCLYLILSSAVSFFLGLMARTILGGGLSPTSPEVIVASEVMGFAGVFSAAWVMSRLEKRHFGEYGLPLRGAFGKRFWQGAVFGLAEISLAMSVLAVPGYYRFGVIELHGLALLRWMAFWAVAFVFVGLYEEFSFRGYVQVTLGQDRRFWLAAVALSLFFGLVHTGSGNYGETWQGIVDIVLTGLFWCFTLRRTGNLWFAVGMHASFDFGETFLFSVPDSGVLLPGHLSNATMAGPAWLTGGTAGPEGSILDPLILLLLFYIFRRLFPARATNPSSGVLPSTPDPSTPETR